MIGLLTEMVDFQVSYNALQDFNVNILYWEIDSVVFAGKSNI